jgi:hypothetical protein
MAATSSTVLALATLALLLQAPSHTTATAEEVEVEVDADGDTDWESGVPPGFCAGCAVFVDEESLRLGELFNKRRYADRGTECGAVLRHTLHVVRARRLSAGGGGGGAGAGSALPCTLPRLSVCRWLAASAHPLAMQCCASACGCLLT